ncbi:MAG: ATP-binding protein [bacterium]
MTLKTRLYLTFYVVIVMLFIATFLIGIVVWNTTKTSREALAADSLLVDLYELRILSLECQFNPSPRAARQWAFKYEQAGQSVAVVADVPKDMVDAFANIRRIYDKIQNRTIDVNESSELYDLLKAQRFGSLHLESQRVIDWTSGVLEKTRERYLSNVKAYGMMLLCLMLVVAFVVTGMIVFAGRYILRAINEVKTGTDRVAAGDLSARISLSGTDEISRLATAFNIMTKDLQQSYREMLQANRLLHAIEGCNFALAQDRNEPDMLVEICRAIVAAKPVSFCWFGLVSGGRGRGIAPAATAGAESGYLENAGYSKAGGELDPSDPLIAALTSGEAVQVRRITAITDNAAWSREARLRHFTALMVLPISVDDKVAGCLTVYKSDTEEFSRGEEGLLRELAQTVSSGLQVRRNLIMRKRAEDDLTRTVQELRDKNAELERFLYTASHDLKTPVVTLQSFIRCLEQDIVLSDTGQVDKDLKFIHAAADKMGLRLDGLLDLSRIGRLSHSPVHVSLRTVVDAAISAIADDIADQGIRVKADDSDVCLSGDEQRLVEIWQNLIENSCRFMGSQKEPCIEIGVVKCVGSGVQTEELLGPSESSSKCESPIFFVKDNGIGIDPCYQSKVFDLFEKLDPKTKGAGMGLAIVKRIVELHEGRIWLESKGEGQGTCFYFTLPGATTGRPA